MTTHRRHQSLPHKLPASLLRGGNPVPAPGKPVGPASASLISSSEQASVPLVRQPIDQGELGVKITPGSPPKIQSSAWQSRPVSASEYVEALTAARANPDPDDPVNQRMHTRLFLTGDIYRAETFARTAQGWSAHEIRAHLQHIRNQRSSAAKIAQMTQTSQRMRDRLVTMRERRAQPLTSTLVRL